MIVSIDYDGTFTADPEIWTEIIKLLQARGHQVICTTNRRAESPGSQEVRNNLEALVPIVFAGNQFKRDAAKQQGWKVDVWMDDNPGTISNDDFLLK